MADKAGRARPPSPAAATTHTLLEAGGETWARLEPLIARRIAELDQGEVMEITTGQPDVPRALRAWCAQYGHALRRVAQGGGHTSCWVTKGGCSEGAEGGAGQG